MPVDDGLAVVGGLRVGGVVLFLAQGGWLLVVSVVVLFLTQGGWEAVPSLALLGLTQEGAVVWLFLAHGGALFCMDCWLHFLQVWGVRVWCRLSCSCWRASASSTCFIQPWFKSNY